MEYNGENFELLRFVSAEDIRHIINYLTLGTEEIIETNQCFPNLGLMMSDKLTML